MWRERGGRSSSRRRRPFGRRNREIGSGLEKLAPGGLEERVRRGPPLRDGGGGGRRLASEGVWPHEQDGGGHEDDDRDRGGRDRRPADAATPRRRASLEDPPERRHSKLVFPPELLEEPRELEVALASPVASAFIPHGGLPPRRASARAGPRRASSRGRSGRAPS